jgi:hypothetical protein
MKSDAGALRLQALQRQVFFVDSMKISSRQLLQHPRSSLQGTNSFAGVSILQTLQTRRFLPPSTLPSSSDRLNTATASKGELGERSRSQISQSEGSDMSIPPSGFDAYRSLPQNRATTSVSAG